METVFLRVFISYFAYFLVKQNTVQENNRQLIILSFDGFRYDYINNYSTPNFDRIANDGVFAPFGYRSTFSTKTFATHWTIATGLFEETHGMIDNQFYDQALNEVFKRGMNDAKWFGGEPIWITAKKQGKTANVIHWPGSEVNFSGLTPDFYFPDFSFEPSLKQRLKMIINWVDKGVDLSMMYFHQPDSSAHKNGVFTAAVKSEVENIDTEIGKFIDELSKPEREHVNLIIIADHGMVNYTEIIALRDYLNFDEEVDRLPQSGPIAGILPKPGKLETVYEKLKNAHPNMSVYFKHEIPERYHYQHPSRTMPILLIADEGFLILENQVKSPRKIGYHGYDNEYLSMHPIFFARGPAFKKHVEIQPFDAVNLYSLFCYILNINESPNNGSIAVFEPILNQNSVNQSNI